MSRNLAQHYGLERIATDLTFIPKVGDYIECRKDVGNITNSPWTQEVLEITEEGYKVSDNSGMYYKIDDSEFNSQYVTEAGNRVFVVCDDKVIGMEDSIAPVVEEPVVIPEPIKSPVDIVPKKALVFLGGTCNESTWRDTLVVGLNCSYFNPVVQNWTEDDKEKENQIKESADYNLFVFTPLHTGFFSFVEAAISAVKSPSRTILCVIPVDNGKSFDEGQARSIEAMVGELDKEGIKVFNNLDDVRSYLNGKEPVIVEETI